MKEICLETKIIQFSIDELPDDELHLIEVAMLATKQSYAPYSDFHVGAAVLLANGIIVTGSNQENAAYPSGLCAERVALFYASHEHPDIPVVALAIAASTRGKLVDHIPPCGACRQVLLEMEQRYNNPVKIILCGLKDVLTAPNATTLLPLSFGRKDLEI